MLPESWFVLSSKDLTDTSSHRVTSWPWQWQPIHGFRASLTEQLLDYPASTGWCRRAGYCQNASPCRTHDQPFRHTMAPTGKTTVPSHPASRSQHISAHRMTNQVRLNEIKSARYMRLLGTRRASGSETTQPNSLRTSDYPTTLDTSNALTVAQRRKPYHA
jgi:hypothetical protein